ncbi:hypothetical protein DSLASN_12240 [Desulfoluna limicola]|uniref:Uncharacterized protein n=2 Tax=Desulfoluna limicola TaxID=2810562 RepID=A0ABN6EZ57_9BACT|nr:hypothetical protein DSLASN_12240 [Desulfoluna limicola]
MIGERIGSYISKRGEPVSFVQAYDNSRGRLINIMWDNIKYEPLQGIGFGIASVPALMIVKRDPVFHLPVSAVVEKGVLPLAVLEEVGVFGLLGVAIWGWMILGRSARAGVGTLAVSITALLLNMGESTLFSPGGLGLLLLILLSWAFANGYEGGGDDSNEC